MQAQQAAPREDANTWRKSFTSTMPILPNRATSGRIGGGACLRRNLIEVSARQVSHSPARIKPDNRRTLGDKAALADDKDMRVEAWAH